jgi:hypothetical protein
MSKFVYWVKRLPTAVLVGAVVAGIVTVSAGAVVTAHAVTNQFANAAMAKLGSNPNEVMNRIADRVVKKIGSNGGPLSTAQQELVDKIAAMAGQKFDGVDPNKMLNDVKNQVAAAGLAKIDGIDPQAILNTVMKQVLAQAMGQISKIDLKSIVSQKVGTLDLNAIVRDQVNKIDINALIKQELDKIDINALVSQIVQQQLSSKTSGGLLSLLSGH